MHRIIFLILLVLVFPASANITGNTRVDISGKARVIDGDTLHIGKTKIRLEGIDAPPLGLSCNKITSEKYLCGRAAAAWLVESVSDKPITCLGDKIDRAGFFRATCYKDSKNLNGAIVLAGWAIAHGRFAPRYEQLEQKAKNAQVGLHAGTYDAPWKW